MSSHTQSVTDSHSRAGGLRGSERSGGLQGPGGSGGSGVLEFLEELEVVGVLEVLEVLEDLGVLEEPEILEKLEALETSKVIFRNLTTTAETVLVLV